jgi:hypothetical protein
MVYVINKNGHALMPCTEVIARLLLKKGGARCICKLPFTIKLTYNSTEYIQDDLVLGNDPGGKIPGFAVKDSKNRILYASEVILRDDIPKKMKRRSKYRRTRRSRKLRRRECRFNNRANSKKIDRFSPTLNSKIKSHIKEIEFIRSILPIKEENIIFEVAKFDVHALKNPEVLKDHSLYQKGDLYGFKNAKAAVLSRDKYICQICKNKSGDKIKDVHHIIFRRNGGSDQLDNLICLCHTCHEKLHKGEVKLKNLGSLKNGLEYASQMNVIISQLLKYYPKAKQTFGFITKENRLLLDLPKEHYIDAAVIACGKEKFIFTQKFVILKKCISKGDYQRTKGIRSEILIPKDKIQGFKKFDKVKYLGKNYFIKGRMSTGYAILSDIYGKKIGLKPIPKFSYLERIRARKSWIIQQNYISNQE